MNAPLKLGLVGFGKIARDEHLPAIAATPGVELVAVATPEGAELGLPVYPTLGEMLAGSPGIEAVVMCQPPVPRFDAAKEAILAGRHVFLEKPPGVTLGEVEILRDLAASRGVSLFAAWHSRWSRPVAALGEWCAARAITGVRIEWKEDVRTWHPGQDWISRPGGFGVFDPGINALSILTAVLPGAMRVTSADLLVPANWATPIAARLALQTPQGAPVAVEFDWRQTGEQIWRITFEAGSETRVFAQGSEAGCSTLALEYRALHAAFVRCVAQRAIEVDAEPLRIVADAFLLARTEVVDRFEL